MKEQIKREVLQQMLKYIDNGQAKRLEVILEGVLAKYIEEQYVEFENSNDTLLSKFLESKRIEGCSEKTLSYYKNTILRMFSEIDKNVVNIITDDLRKYLTDYQKNNNLSRVTIDNVRRILSSFFSWLEDEDYLGNQKNSGF